MSEKKIVVKKVKITDLIPDPANARTHNPKNIDAIKGSLARFGLQKPIVISSDNVVIAGNGTLEAAKALGWTEISCIQSDLKGAEITAYGIADNRTAELAEWDDDILGKHLQALREDGFDLGDLGFELPDLTDLGFDSPEEKPPENLPEEEDEEEPQIELPTETSIKLGDTFEVGKAKLYCGDSLEVLKTFAENSLESVVTDPPAGISFMGKAWDEDKGGRDEWILWLKSIMSECLRVLKPGGHAFVWAIPRTSHWTAKAIEDSGFEIRDVISHIFGSGFPKSHDIAKNIDKVLGEKREIVGTLKSSGMNKIQIAQGQQNYSKLEFNKFSPNPISDEAKQFSGFGTALKPASEHWILCRKPLSEKSVAENVLKHGTGGINIAGTRICYKSEDDFAAAAAAGEAKATIKNNWEGINMPGMNTTNIKGRFPSNFMLSHHEGCKCVGMKEVKGYSEKSTGGNQIYGSSIKTAAPIRYNNENGTETVEDWQCVEACPVRLLGEESRFFKSFSPEVPFFYCAKSSTSERNEGCEELPLAEGPGSKRSTPAEGRESALGAPRQNFHPTVKPQKLMRYLTRMVTPPAGTVLDCFNGSGSTGIAALKEGFSYIGIEREPMYCEITLARLKNVKG